MNGGKQPIDARILPVSACFDNIDGSHGGWWHGFPTTKEELQVSLKEIGARSGGEVIAHRYNTGPNYLDERLPRSLTPDTLDELNYLASVLELRRLPTHIHPARTRPVLRSGRSGALLDPRGRAVCALTRTRPARMLEKARNSMAQPITGALPGILKRMHQRQMCQRAGRMDGMFLLIPAARLIVPASVREPRRRLRHQNRPDFNFPRMKSHQSRPAKS